MNLLLNSIVPIPIKENVTKKLSDIWLRDLTLVKGKQIFLQAPSGTGKTTLIHMLYGLRKDYEGTIIWDDKNIADINPGQLAYLRATFVSIVFQDMRLFPNLTAWENIEVKRVVTNTVTEQRVQYMLEQLGILHKKDAMADKLSYGEQQRVAIIRALVQPFDWLLLDEPFSHLDKANIEKAAALMHETVAKNGAGMILADLEPNDHFPYHQKMRL